MNTEVEILTARKLTSLLNKGGFVKQVIFKGTVMKFTNGKGYKIEKYGFYTYHSAIGQRLSRSFTSMGEYRITGGKDEQNSIDVIANYLTEQGLKVSVQENSLVVSNGKTIKYEKVSVDTGIPELVTI
jgi:hypothetical protein